MNFYFDPLISLVFCFLKRNFERQSAKTTHTVREALFYQIR